MSLILDALRKLDREKSSRLNGTADIAVEILKPDLPRPGKRVGLYSATVFLTVVATTAIIYAVIVQLGFLPKSWPPAPVSPPAPGEQVVPSPAPLVREPVRNGRDKIRRVEPKIQDPAKSQQVAPAPHSPESVRGARDEMRQAVPKIEIPAETKEATEIQKPAESKDSVTSLGEKKASQDAIPGKGDIAPGSAEKAAEYTPNISAVTPASLKISGIVWHEEPSKRLAVINGMIATEGFIIEGIKVLEIYPDRVRFLHNGEYFEIPFR